MGSFDDGGGMTLRPLTQRQREVLDGISAGNSNKEIARALGIAPETVKVHVEALLRHYRMRNRVQLAVMASKQ